MAKRVGIFSGTFDPVHLGHLAFAKEALGKCRLDKVFFMVEPRPRRKQGVKALEHRQAMVRLAIADEPLFSSLIIDQARFSVAHTLPLLQARFEGSKLYFLMGEDFLVHLTNWPHIEKLVQNVTFAIGLRHQTAAEVRSQVQELEKTRGLKLNYQIFQAEHADYTSTSIRQALRRGQSPAGVPLVVLDYIKQYELYASTATSPK